MPLDIPLINFPLDSTLLCWSFVTLTTTPSYEREVTQMKTGRTHQKQVNIRLDDETLRRIDNCRSELLKIEGEIPPRADIVREAIDRYLDEFEKGQLGGKP
jgi:predicted DNA-binding protein